MRQLQGVAIYQKEGFCVIAGCAIIGKTLEGSIMGVLITPTTSAVTSNPFVVQRGETVGLSQDGLQGSEKARVMRLNAFGQFVATSGDGAHMDAASPSVRIVASGTYRIEKEASLALAGVTLD